MHTKSESQILKGRWEDNTELILKNQVWNGFNLFRIASTDGL